MVRRVAAATEIQRFFREKKFMQQNNQLFEMHSAAATIIQARARGISARNRYYTAFFGFIRLQAIYRGVLGRRAVGEMMYRQQQFEQEHQKRAAAAG